MFKNSGKKIMGLVMFVFILNLILAVLGGIAGVFLLMDETGLDAAPAVIVSVLGALVYILIVYLLLLGTYAFGELVQSNIEIRRNQERILERMEELTAQKPGRPQNVNWAPNPYAPPAPAAPRAPMPPVPPAPPAPRTPAPAPYPTAPAQYAPAQQSAPAAENGIICPTCGMKQPAAASFCRVCGTSLAKTEPEE